jgi:hypothetical protein
MEESTAVNKGRSQKQSEVDRRPTAWSTEGRGKVNGKVKVITGGSAIGAKSNNFQQTSTWTSVPGEHQRKAAMGTTSQGFDQRPVSPHKNLQPKFTFKSKKKKEKMPRKEGHDSSYQPKASQYTQEPAAGIHIESKKKTNNEDAQKGRPR